MKPSLAARHVLSVSACCRTMYSESGPDSRSSRWPARRGDTETSPKESVTSAQRASRRRPCLEALEASCPEPVERGAAEASMPGILHRVCGVGGACVRASEPLAQLASRFVRCRPVKRHQSRRHPGDAHDTGAPAILGDRLHFDEIQTSCDGFFEAIDFGGHVRGRLNLKFVSALNCTQRGHRFK